MPKDIKDQSDSLPPL
jgi:hypothetical protein